MREPRIEAFLPEEDRETRLAAAADAVAARFPDGAPLFGALLGVKDVFRVDGLPTRAGTRLPPEVFAGPEAVAVTRLRDAGALVVGKTVSTELAFFAPGPTRNPHHPEHTPGGSSSGSAAAVAAGLADLALGTQTIGSVCRPAAFCGVFGWKPTRGCVPSDGVVPLAPSLDHVGLFARDAELLTRGAAALCAGWRAGTATVTPSPRDLLLAVPVGPYLDRAGEEMRRRFDEVAARVAAADASVVEVAAFRDHAEIEARNRRVLAAEFARAHRDLLAAHRDALDEKTVALGDEGAAISDDELRRDLAACAALAPALEATMDVAGFELWLTPAAPGPAPRGLASTGDPVMNLPWTQAGLPAVVLPAGRAANGLPLGVQLVARRGRDEELLAAAAALAEVVAG